MVRMGDYLCFNIQITYSLNCPWILFPDTKKLLGVYLFVSPRDGRQGGRRRLNLYIFNIQSFKQQEQLLDFLRPGCFDGYSHDSNYLDTNIGLLGDECKLYTRSLAELKGVSRSAITSHRYITSFHSSNPQSPPTTPLTSSPDSIHCHQKSCGTIFCLCSQI